MLHLIHPALVHLTVAFLIAGGLAEAFGVFWHRPPAERVGTVLVVAGTLALVPTLLTGFLAENALTLSEAGAAAVDQHERYGIMVLGVFLPLLLVRAWGRGRIPDDARTLYAAGLIVGVGGRMVYELGVGVR
jgi:uncharacterized membrane protein